MDRPDPASLRHELEELATPQLIQALADRESEDWLPEAYEMMEAILRERGVALPEAVVAARRLQPDPSLPADRVIVATALNHVDAQLIRMRLEEAGMEVYLTDESTTAVLAVPAIGVRVMVSAADAEAATKVLAEPPLPVERECPVCGSDSVEHQERRDRGATIALTLIAGVPAPLVRHQCRCRACGHEWEE